MDDPCCHAFTLFRIHDGRHFGTSLLNLCSERVKFVAVFQYTMPLNPDLWIVPQFAILCFFKMHVARQHNVGSGESLVPIFGSYFPMHKLGLVCGVSFCRVPCLVCGSSLSTFHHAWFIFMGSHIASFPGFSHPRRNIYQTFFPGEKARARERRQLFWQDRQRFCVLHVFPFVL